MVFYCNPGNSCSIYFQRPAERNGPYSIFFSVGGYLTLALSFALNPQITKFVQENTPIYHMIQENCQESLMKDTEVKINEKTDSGEQNQFIQELPLPENVKALLIENNNAQGYQHLLAETFTEYISRSIAAVAVSILGMIVTFLAISIILHIIGGILNSIFSLPVLNPF